MVEHQCQICDYFVAGPLVSIHIGVWSWEDGLASKGLLYKLESLSSNPQKACEARQSGTHL